MSKFIVYASGVHQGGGLVLLNALLRESVPGYQCYVFVDDRGVDALKPSGSWQVITSSNSAVGRVKAELALARMCGRTDKVLCFGNLPPLFALKGQVSLFIGNRYFVEPVRIPRSRRRLDLRLLLQKIWLHTRIHNCAKVAVQTPSMARAFEKNVSSTIRPFVLPTFPEALRFSRATKLRDRSGDTGQRVPTFFYPATEEPHKNHLLLLAAFIELAKQGLTPKLYLTVRHCSEIASRVRDINKTHKTQIINLGPLPHVKVMEVYEEVTTLIFPSTAESFGLPLVEARIHGKDIIASELDFTRDLVDPEQTFNPFSEISIARAVSRYLGEEEEVTNVKPVGELVSWLLA